jgi:hypothetical protein
MSDNIFDRYRKLLDEEDFDYYIEGDEPTVEEVIEEIFREGVDEEIYRVRVLRNPRSPKGTLVFPTYGYLRYLPKDEIQFWSFPGDEGSTMPLRDLLRVRADKLRDGDLDADSIWEMIVWKLDDEIDDSDDIVNIHNTGMVITIWYTGNKSRGLVLQILGVG